MSSIAWGEPGLLKAHFPAGPKPDRRFAQLDPDAALVARVQNGDADAFGELVNRHRRRVYRTLAAIIGNGEEAQDATQDTFLKALEHIGEFQHRSKLATWLVSIATNTGLQWLRERRPMEYLDDVRDGLAFHSRKISTNDANPEQLCSQAERRKLVKCGVMKVPYKYRAVLVLRDIEQLSTEQAAGILGLSVPAVKARLFRARMMLRDVLSPYFQMLYVAD